MAVWDAVKLAALAAIEVWLLIQRPIWATLALLGRLYLGFWGLVWDVVGPVVGLVWSLWSGLIGLVWDLATWLWDGLRQGWGLLVDWLSGLWRIGTFKALSSPGQGSPGSARVSRGWRGVVGLAGVMLAVRGTGLA